jgi:predicted metalloprotease
MPTMRRVALSLLLVVLALAAVGCGGSDNHPIRDRAEAIRKQLREERDHIRARVRQVLSQIEQAIPKARQTSPEVQSRGRTGATTIDQFLSGVLESVDSYWSETFKRNGLREPVVSAYWLPPGARIRTACGPAGADAAFYCPTDDTIYVSQEFASELWRGVVHGLPGERAGFGHAAGDFGVAYVVAHEYAHNVQNELGLFARNLGPTAEPLELQADCLAGAWGNSVYRQGRLEPGDVQEAINTALAVGDFDTSNAQHHGTPQQRRDAWLLGFDSGDPSRCGRYVPLG